MLADQIVCFSQLVQDVHTTALDSTRVKYRLASEQKASWPEDLQNLPQGIVLPYATQLLVPLIRLGIGMAKPPLEAGLNLYHATHLWRSHWQPARYNAPDLWRSHLAILLASIKS